MPARTKFFIFAFLFCIPLSVFAANEPTTIGGYPADEALRLGERMYIKGILPSGQPMRALVHEDIEVSGSMLTCNQCHMRSGLGSYEGGVLTPPTNGAKLYAPLLEKADIPGSALMRDQFRFRRPAYTDESLAASLRYGIDPAGRLMMDTMPRYILTDDEMDIMVFYLKNLSSRPSPGVTDQQVRFVTIVTEGVSARDRNAMLEPLKAFLSQEWNANVAILGQMQRVKGYREAALDVWELKGPANTWEGQLEALYRKQPVFAVLSGLASGPWSPIHRFCEKNKIPCIFPITDLPEISPNDLYTLYYWKGYYQEGDAAAKYLGRVFALPPDKTIVQVLRDEDRGRALARGFAETWKKLGGTAPLKNRVLAPGEAAGRDLWKGLSAEYGNAVFLLWLGPEDLAGIESIADLPQKPSLFFASATMLGKRVQLIPDAIRDITFITYPYRMPGEEVYISNIVEQWLKYKKIPPANAAISAKVYFLTRVLADTMTSMRGDLYRDFFLDLLDTMVDQTIISLDFPRLSFGPGQRYASKGCYIVTLTRGAQPKVVRESEWIIY